MVALLAVAAVSGCTPKQEAMPVLLTARDDGWVDASFAVCRGDSLVSLAVSNAHAEGHPDVRQQEPGRAKLSEDKIFKAELSPATLGAGRLSDDLESVANRPFQDFGGGVPGLGSMFVETFDYAAEFTFANVDLSSTGAVLVRGGGATYREYSVTPVVRVEGEAVIADWCATTRKD